MPQAWLADLHPAAGLHLLNPVGGAGLPWLMPVHRKPTLVLSAPRSTDISRQSTSSAAFYVLQEVELSSDGCLGLSGGFAYVEYEKRADAEKAKDAMDGGQLDGVVLT